jgi:hypothetical protein
VVTGQDAQGRSVVLYDGPAPNVSAGTPAAPRSSAMTDVWIFKECPAKVSGTEDESAGGHSFDPPAAGGHLRIVQSDAKKPGYDPAQDKGAKPLCEPYLRANSHTWERGGQNAYSSPIHKSQTIDWAVVLDGKRTLLLDDGEYVLQKGDTVVQLANWHGWSNAESDSTIAFVMIGGVDDGRGPGRS